MAKIYRNRIDQVLLVCAGIVEIVAVVRLFSEPSLENYEDYGYALFFAAMGWFFFRAGIRAHVSVTATTIRVVNLIREVTVPKQEISLVDADAISLFMVTRDGRKIRAWGVASSALNRLKKVQSSINSTPSVTHPRQDSSDPQNEAIQTRVRADLWFFILLYAVFVADIIFQRLGWWG